MCWVLNVLGFLWTSFSVTVQYLWSASSSLFSCQVYTVCTDCIHQYRVHVVCTPGTRVPRTTYNFKNIINRSLIFVFVYHLFSLLF